MDGLPNEIGKITEAIDLIVQYKGHKSQSKFYISSVSHKAIILGHTWLVEHNPNINWCTGEVKLTCCPDYCKQAKSDSSCLDNNISVHLVEVTLERIHATTTISTQLAEATKEDTPTAKLKEMLLKPYLGFWDMFSKKSFNELPERKQWDHMIDPKPESQPFSMKVYPMSPIKQNVKIRISPRNMSKSRKWVVRDVSKNQIGDSEHMREWLRKPMRRSERVRRCHMWVGLRGTWLEP